jgi:antitoxin component HigA of HigAB toxin-antitoxin module
LRAIYNHLTPGQADYLYALSELVSAYEQSHHPIEDADLDAVEKLQYLLEESGMTASDLGRLLGNRQLGSAILRRERELSKTHIVKLCEHFKVSADLFLRTKG